MGSTYNDYVIESFRENSIRSVTLIDDQVVPYHVLINDIEKSNAKIQDTREKQPEPSKLIFDLKESMNAAAISEFFLKKQILCDIDDGAEHIDYEKIRKSDLIILDYHLEPGDSTKSRELIDQLSSTPHMNLVVIYTLDDLMNVWNELSLHLHGALHDDFSEEVEEIWDNLCQGRDIPAEFDAIITEDELQKIPFERKLSSAAYRTISGILDNGDKRHSKLIGTKLTLEYLKRVRGITTKFLDREIHGSNENVLWLQVGSVFVTFFRKGESGSSENEPEQLWDRLKDALIDWAPSYYQLMLSEIQNSLEDQNLPMDKLISKGKFEQSAMLWSMLHGIQSERTDNPIQVILRNIYDYLYGYSLTDSRLQKFLLDSAKSVDSQLPDFVDVPKGNQDPDINKKYDEYQDRLVKISLSNYDSKAPYNTSENDRLHIVHAFNKELSLSVIKSKYITTGMLFKDKDKQAWYLCVSPSCNTVAGQLTDNASKRMQPNRALRFLELEKCCLKTALGNATQSKFIFCCDCDLPIALRVVHAQTNLPIIEVGVVHNHDDIELSSEGKKVSFIAGPKEDTQIHFDEKVLIPIGQVKESYAARFQNIQSHYEGRIGVDFVPL